MNIIGISAHFHDAACCVIKDGRLVAAVEEERLSRIKHDPRLPHLAFRFCLREAGLSIADVDCVAYYEDPAKKLGRQLWMAFPRLPRGGVDARRPQREIRELLGYHGPIHIVEHHQAHAASSFYYSGFADAAVATFDGVGEWTTTSYGVGSGHRVDRFEEVQFPHSLGLLYSTITSYLGFEVNEGEYKVMGLAPYGKPRYVDQVRALVHSQRRGQFRLDLSYFDFITGDRMFSDALPALFGRPPRPPESELESFHEDVARSLQVVLEDILLEKIRYLHDRVGSDNLCLAGGVALNCVANGRIAREGPFRNLFVQPAASDAGGALGAAASAWADLTGTGLREPLRHVYLGPGFSPVSIRELLAATPSRAESFDGREDALLDAACQRLADGKILGWFQGRVEFGPRSLGARSILADPRHPGMRDKINALVKKREAFRPFAPAVLESAAAQHFELDGPSPFMLQTCQVRSPLDLPAITHVDGSARVQTVSAATNPRFARLLERFAALTGCPILLNTSFNMRGEPIVCTPLDALLCFVRSRLDALVIEDCLLDREALAPGWFDLVTGIGRAVDPGVTHDVYTFF
jgi:carbamoyltransferase